MTRKAIGDNTTISLKLSAAAVVTLESKNQKINKYNHNKRGPGQPRVDTSSLILTPPSSPNHLFVITFLVVSVYYNMAISCAAAPISCQPSYSRFFAKSPPAAFILQHRRRFHCSTTLPSHHHHPCFARPWNSNGRHYNAGVTPSMTTSRFNCRNSKQWNSGYYHGRNSIPTLLRMNGLMHTHKNHHRQGHIAFSQSPSSNGDEITTNYRDYMTETTNINATARNTTTSTTTTTTAYSNKSTLQTNDIGLVHVDNEPNKNMPLFSWEGMTHSTSEFVTHYQLLRAGGTFHQGMRKNDLCGNVTVEDAIRSILPPKDAVRNANRNNFNDISTSLGVTVLGLDNYQQQQQQQNVQLAKVVEPALWYDPSTIPLDEHLLGATELLALGSVWFLPAGTLRDPSRGGKPIRLTILDADRILKEGDYLRIHHSPRRFPVVHQYDWGAKEEEDNISIDNQTKKNGKEKAKHLPGVIIKENSNVGYTVINKPPGVPVHACVDNILENVAAAYGRALLRRKRHEVIAALDRIKGRDDVSSDQSSDADASPSQKAQRTKAHQKKKKEEPLIYVTTNQRLDQNTSGLLVLSTKKSFASYFAQLLRYKTDKQLSAFVEKRGDDDSAVSLAQGEGGIHKKYKCLVCVIPRQRIDDESASPPSMNDELDRLHRYASNQTIIRHFLEPSIKAPKTFVSETGNSTWAECLLRITHAGEAYPVIGSNASQMLSGSLWNDVARMPRGCVAVVEVDVELLTGRTHQIRGQLSAEGYPLVGDSQYGGALPVASVPDSKAENDSLSRRYDANSDRLALQCCEVEFLDPDFVRDSDGNENAVPSDRWNTFRLGKAWWTPHLDRYGREASTDIPTTSTSDQEQVSRLKVGNTTSVDDGAAEERVDVDTDITLPPRASLSPGLHKYVLVKASRPNSKPIWFVKSASPSECGGAYHANVAEDLVRRLNDAGYYTRVMGGGRIEYDEKVPHAHVFGFSYGFGKGDHAKAASIIEEWSDGKIITTFDDSDGIY